MSDEQKSKEQLVDEINEIRRLNRDLKDTQDRLNLALQSLKDSEERFRAVARSAVDAIISTDSEDRVVFWNKGATRIFGHTEPEVIGKSVTIIIPERYKEAHTMGIRRYLETGRPSLIGGVAELSGLKKDGAELPIELALSTWRTKDGRFFTGIIRDITERKEVHRELEQRRSESEERNEELESLIQMVAHDLKSPVITIAGFVKKLRRMIGEGSSPEKMEPALHQVVTATGTVEKFLGDLLDSLASEHNVPEKSPLSMEELVREVIHQKEQLFSEKNITLEFDPPDQLPQIVAERRRILQVLDNLVGNAANYMGERDNPVIRVDIHQGNEVLITSIADNGVGIPNEYQSKIFDRFVRIKNTPGGTGLGLAISKKIVQSFGGRIWLDSEEGHGATFRFSLPVYFPSEWEGEDR